MASLTASATATALVPDCRRTSSDTARSPLRRERLRSSSVPSSTLPRSRTSIGPPGRCATTMSPKSAGVWMRPRVRTTNSRAGVSMRPPGTSRFSAASARVTSSTARPYAAIRSALSQPRISRSRPPTISIDPTPLTRSRRSFTTSLANVVSSFAGRSPDSARARIGEESGSSFSMTGSSRSAGSRRRTADTLSRTSCAATSTSRSSSNSTTTMLTPSVLVERSVLTPLIVLIASSRCSVTSVSTVSGSAPGRIDVTVTIGKSTFGNRSMPRPR